MTDENFMWFLSIVSFENEKSVWGIKIVEKDGQNEEKIMDEEKNI